MDLESLSLEDLKTLKKRWWEEGKESGILDLCRDVARRLGTCINTDYMAFEWEADRVRIYFDAMGGILVVRVDGATVVSSRDWLCVPGAWQDVVRRYADQAAKGVTGIREQADEAARARLMRELLLVQTPPPGPLP
jgi:hypothetical protein